MDNNFEFTWSDLIGSVSFCNAADAVAYFAQQVVDPQTGFNTTLASLLDGPSLQLLYELEDRI